MANNENDPVSTSLYTHIGNSMVPTLRTFDQVYVAADRSCCPGDIILFVDPSTGKKIVHRVISINGERVVTRGDNNLLPDTSTVCMDEVLGKVIYIRRKGKAINIRGGWPGTMSIAPHRASMLLRHYLAKLAVTPYHILAWSGIFRIWLPDNMKPQTISIMGTEGPELRVMMGKRTAGVWRPGYAGWLINPPYKLFLDEKTLPVVPSCSGGACSVKGVTENGRGDKRSGN